MLKETVLANIKAEQSMLGILGQKKVAAFVGKYCQKKNQVKGVKRLILEGKVFRGTYIITEHLFILHTLFVNSHMV